VDQREVFLAAVDGVNRADMARIEEVVHPEMIFHPIRAPVSGDYYGHRGVEKFIEDNAETFDVFEIAYDDMRMLDDGRLFAAGKVRIRGRGGHVDTVVDTAGYARFRDGLLCEWHDYGDRAAAKAALGIT
jgi:ketosteroid isomerase-like protein